MDVSAKEALGFIVAVICVTLVIIALYNVRFFNGIKSFINASAQSETVQVIEPPQEAERS